MCQGGRAKGLGSKLRSEYKYLKYKKDKRLKCENKRWLGFNHNTIINRQIMMGKKEQLRNTKKRKLPNPKLQYNMLQRWRHRVNGQIKARSGDQIAFYLIHANQTSRAQILRNQQIDIARPPHLKKSAKLQQMRKLHFSSSMPIFLPNT